MPLPTGQISTDDIRAYMKVNTGGPYSYSGALSFARLFRAAHISMGGAESPTSQIDMNSLRGRNTVVSDFTQPTFQTWLYWDARNPACCRRDWGYNEQNSSTTANYWYSRADVWKIDASHNQGAGYLEPQHGGRWTFDGYSTVMWTAAYIRNGYNHGNGPWTTAIWFQPYDPDVYTNCCWSNRYAITQYYKRFIIPAISPTAWGDYGNASLGIYMSRYRIEIYVHGYDWGYCGAAIGICDRYATPTLAMNVGFNGYDLGWAYYNGTTGSDYIGDSRGKYTYSHIEEICGDAYGRASGKCTMALYYRSSMNPPRVNTFWEWSRGSHSV